MRTNLPLMQIGLELERYSQGAGDDARGFARALVRTRYHEPRMEQFPNTLCSLLRLPISQFGQRQIVRRNRIYAVSIPQALTVPDENEIAHAWCASCKAAICRNHILTAATSGR